MNIQQFIEATRQYLFPLPSAQPAMAAAPLHQQH